MSGADIVRVAEIGPAMLLAAWMLDAARRRHRVRRGPEVLSATLLAAFAVLHATLEVARIGRPSGPTLVVGAVLLTAGALAAAWDLWLITHRPGYAQQIQH